MLQNSTVFSLLERPSLITSHSQSVTVEKETPLDVDAGFLTVTDLTPIDEDSYKYADYFSNYTLVYSTSPS
jgi:hypothetical protein